MPENEGLCRDRRGEQGDRPVPAAGVPAPYEGENVLAGCILQLSARYREALLLRYGYGYSLRETADLMGVTVSAATQIIHRAKIKLRTLYEKEERT